MKLNLKKPRYIIPLIILPFICIFFYTYKTSFGKARPLARGRDSLQDNIADVSDQVRKSKLAGKLEAYRQQYKKSDGYTAVDKIQDDTLTTQPSGSLYNEKEKHLLDSIRKAVNRKYGRGSASQSNVPLAGFNSTRSKYRSPDQELAAALNSMKVSNVRSARQEQRPSEADPMQLFRQQMSLIDSVSKSNDPAFRAEQQRKQLADRERQEQRSQKRLPVAKAAAAMAMFNTIRPEQNDGLIRAIIDQDITAYAGSRLRIRLLEDMMAGHFLIRQGTYLYAQVSGFSGQRVLLTIGSIMQAGELMPVKLDIYDNDGLPGLYVPASAFRDFTRDLGGGVGQGMSLQQQADNNSQVAMSIVQKMFESTTTAVSKLIRQNKAKLKYNTLVYLIDPESLRNHQQNQQF